MKIETKQLRQELTDQLHEIEAKLNALDILENASKVDPLKRYGPEVSLKELALETIKDQQGDEISFAGLREVIEPYIEEFSGRTLNNQLQGLVRSGAVKKRGKGKKAMYFIIRKLL